MQQEWTAAEVRQIIGVSQRCLDYWDERGYILPSGQRPHKGSKEVGRGSKRRYTFGDLLRLGVVKRLRDAGLSLQKIGKVLARLRSDRAVSDVASEVLITDGKRVERVRRDGTIEDLLRAGQLVFAAVSLGDIDRTLRERIVKLQRLEKPMTGGNDSGGVRGIARN